MSVSSSAKNVYVAGRNGSQCVVQSYYPNGSLVWTRLFGSNPGRISVLAGSNGFYVTYDHATGTGLLQDYDSSGTLQRTRSCSCEPMGITGDGTALYVFGTIQAASLVPPDSFLTKYDLNGNQLWTTNFTPPIGPAALPGVREVRGSADSSGVYLVETTGDGRGIVVKYDSAGGPDWSLQLPWIISIGYSPSEVITVQQSTVSVGGGMRTNAPPSGYTETAFVTAISKSSSLVFFG